MRYIHQLPERSEFHWDAAVLSVPLANVRHKQGLLLGQMRGLGFRLRDEAGGRSTSYRIASAEEIEGR